MALLRLIPIAKVYAAEQEAKNAVDALGREGFDEADISLITPAMIASATSDDDDGDEDTDRRVARLVAEAHEASEVPPGHAEVYAAQLRQGRSLVLVTAPFGEARRATQALDDAGPSLDYGELPPLEYHTWMQPAPLSAALGLPVLSHGRSWMSSAFPELARDFLPTRGWFGGLLSHRSTPLSSAIGMPVLSNEPAPLSSKFGLKLLRRDDPAPLSALAGLPVLSNERPAKKTSSFGLPLLSRNPTPLSSMFGLPVLSRPKTATDPDVRLEKSTSADGETLPR